jgi:hypothetical protein
MMETCRIDNNEDAMISATQATTCTRDRSRASRSPSALTIGIEEAPITPLPPVEKHLPGKSFLLIACATVPWLLIFWACGLF